MRPRILLVTTESLYAGNGLHRAAAFLAGLDADAEDPFRTSALHRTAGPHPSPLTGPLRVGSRHCRPGVAVVGPNLPPGSGQRGAAMWVTAVLALKVAQGLYIGQRRTCVASARLSITCENVVPWARTFQGHVDEVYIDQKDLMKEPM